MPKQVATIKDVAAHAGVSVATVTNVLYGRCGRFTPDTEERVRRAIEQLGYRPNLIARSLVRRTTNTLGFVIDHLGRSLMLNPYFALLFDGAFFAARREGYQMKLIAPSTRDLDAVRRQTEDGSIDGAIVAAPRYGSKLLEWAEACPMPCVVAGTIPELPELPCADVDDEGASHDAVRWLASLGHTRIGLLAGPPDYWSARQREAGYRRALAGEGILPDPGWIARGDFSTESGRPAIRELLRARPALTAVFISNDWMAFGALEALRREGVRVPEDLSIVGFDDAEAAAIAHPPLTTIRQPVREIGGAAAAILVRRLRHGGAAAEREVFPGVLVHRESVVDHEGNLAGPDYRCRLAGGQRTWDEVPL